MAAVELDKYDRVLKWHCKDKNHILVLDKSWILFGVASLPVCPSTADKDLR